MNRADFGRVLCTCIQRAEKCPEYVKKALLSGEENGRERIEQWATYDTSVKNRQLREQQKAKWRRKWLSERGKEVEQRLKPGVLERWRELQEGK